MKGLVVVAPVALAQAIGLDASDLRRFTPTSITSTVVDVWADSHSETVILHAIMH
jgi:hypothetical protein